MANNKRECRPGIDLTTVPGNPAYDLTQSYSDLMSITDPTQLHDLACSIVRRRLHLGGVSENNARVFFHTMANALDECLSNSAGESRERGLIRMQGYLSNYILRAARLGVI